MVAGLIHDVPTVHELIDRIMAEAEAIITERLAASCSDPHGAPPMNRVFTPLRSDSTACPTSVGNQGMSTISTVSTDCGSPT